MKIEVCSEIGKLEGVIVHTPGREVEEMTPGNAKRALYSDILNLSVAQREYSQLKGVLSKVSQTFEVTDLLSDILKIEDIKNKVLNRICRNENAMHILPDLMNYNADEVARLLIQGVPIRRDNLTRFLSEERFSLRPLHNFLFTRDASMSFNNEVIIGKMANTVRNREAIIMEAIFDHHPNLETKTINPGNSSNAPELKLEGGDFLAGDKNLIVIGIGMRTSTQAIDYIIDKIKAEKTSKFNILVQSLPDYPESFIHLDMVFTFLDIDTCMVYEPLIYGTDHLNTIHIEIDNGKVAAIKNEKNLPSALKKLGYDLKPVTCGGADDIWAQEREQWHSGANFFAFAPGQIIGYERNVHTIEELNKNGFEVIKAEELLNGSKQIPQGKCVITIAGSELARGGGGARCMTMPIRRQAVSW